MHLAEVRNSILQCLGPDLLSRLRPYLRRVQVKRGQILQESHRPLEWVYFIERGMAVLMARTKRDGQVGVAIIGHAGLVGIPIVLGTMRSPHHCVMEVEGEALRIGAETFRRAIEGSSTLRQQLMNYVQALIVQESQTALCNARHPLAERLTRLLLLAHDRLDGDTIPLTHDLLSMMLGVRRAGITTALERLERSDAIRKTRGALEIVDRNLLERTTCECYRIITTEHERLIDFSLPPHVPERHSRHLAPAE